MNKICETCPHLKRGTGLLKLYDKIVRQTFFDCPKNDKGIVGCITKETDIPWEAFIEFLREKDASGQ